MELIAKIKEEKKYLNRLVEEKQDLQHPEVIEISEKIDELVVQYYKGQKCV